MEQHMRQAKEEEEFLIAMNKKGREDLLKEISEVRDVLSWTSSAKTVQL
jgi:hypothetical protein